MTNVLKKGETQLDMMSHTLRFVVFPFMPQKEKKNRKKDNKQRERSTHYQVKYLIGAADQFKDVDLWMWFSIVCE